MFRNLSVATLVAVITCAPASRAQQLCGDCNGDGSAATIIDALTAAQISAAVSVPSALQLCACDVNSASAVSIVDALLLAQSSAGLPISLVCPQVVCGGGGGGSPPTVSITSPVGGTHAGVVTLTIDADDLDSDPLLILFEFSTNGGTTYATCITPGTGSIPSNPILGVAVPVTSGTLDWNTVASAVGAAGPQTVMVRCSVNDGTLGASDTTTFDVNNFAPPSGCTPIACGGNLPGAVGPGTAGYPPPVFTSGPAGDTTFFLANVSARSPGDSVVVTITNLSDDHDLYVGISGISCGDTDPLNYIPSPGFAGTLAESILLTDAQLAPYGGMVPIAVYHYDPTPTGTYNVTVACVPPSAGGCATATCGSLTPGMTGPGTGLVGPTLFTPGPTGDSQAFNIDVRGRAAGTVVRVVVTNISDDCDLFVPLAPGVMCGDTNGGNFDYSASSGLFGLVDEYHTFTDLEATSFGDQIPIWVYHYDPAPTATFTVSVTCAMPGGCTGTVEQTINMQPTPITIMGDTTGGDDTASVGCGTGGDPGDVDHVIEFIPGVTATYTLSLCAPTTAHDTILGVRQGDCAAGLEIGCNDDTCGLVSEVSALPLTAGTSYYIIIDGWGGEVGPYQLDITSP